MGVQGDKGAGKKTFQEKMVINLPDLITNINLHM